jgi:hypothetical protein
MPDDQTANQTTKPLKEGKKEKEKENHQFSNSKVSGLVVLMLLL